MATSAPDFEQQHPVWLGSEGRPSTPTFAECLFFLVHREFSFLFLEKAMNTLFLKNVFHDTLQERKRFTCA